MISTNPIKNQIIKNYDEHSQNQVDDIIDAADRIQIDWRLTSFDHRCKLMKKAADHLRNNFQKLAELITIEMGKPIKESIAEINKCAWVCDYYAEKTNIFLQDEIIDTDASHSYVTFDPLGIVLAIMPWNFPFWQVFRFAAPALMAGNAAILKHASNVSGCALAIEKIFQKAGFPSNLFRTLLISSSKVHAVVSHPKIKAVTLTGSEWAGSEVAAQAGKEIKKTVLELGGSDPFIVFEDADLDECSKTAIIARMLNTGQSCIAAKRFIVINSIYEKFTEKIKKLMQKLNVGDPLLESTDIGPLARPDLVDEIDSQVKRSVQMGAKLLLGGQRSGDVGCFYEPTLLTDVKKGMAVYDEETFGPVFAIIPVADENQAIEIANDSQFGLGASIWTSDLKKAKRIAHQIESGAVFINGMVKSDPRLPFGGIKRSGYGRELANYGIKEFVNIKTVWIK